MRLAIVLGALLTLAAGGAQAHSFFLPKCCGGRDCLPASPASVTWTPAGWAVEATQEIVAFDDKRIQYNPPGVPQFFICRLPEAPRLICLYIPAPES